MEILFLKLLNDIKESNCATRQQLEDIIYYLQDNNRLLKQIAKNTKNDYQ